MKAVLRVMLPWAMDQLQRSSYRSLRHWLGDRQYALPFILLDRLTNMDFCQGINLGRPHFPVGSGVLKTHGMTLT